MPFKRDNYPFAFQFISSDLGSVENLKQNRMKKLTWLIILVLIHCTSISKAQRNSIYPIPSYNILVEGTAVFQENTNMNTAPMAKRNIQVKVTHKSQFDSATCSITVYLYSLDLQNHLGPFTLYSGQTLVQEIDDNPWGVYVETECIFEVSVWIDE